MDAKRKKIEQEVERTMRSLDQLQRYKGDPAFFQRLQEHLVAPSPSIPLRRIDWRMAAAVALLVINLSVMALSLRQNTSSLSESVAEAYSLTAGSSDYYSNSN